MPRVLAATALLGLSALARADWGSIIPGSAVVVNKCSYTVYLHDVPAAGEGADEINPSPLSSGQSWSQPWTGLTSLTDPLVHDGWSIKLSKTADFVDGNILQFEYTYQPTININEVWLDLSSVNGNNNPWLTEGWTIASSESCGTALQQGVSYMNPDDNAAMQPACPATASFTLTLCEKPADSGAWGSSSSASSSSVVAPSSSAPSSSAPSSSAPSSSAAPPPSSTSTVAATTSVAPPAPTIPAFTPPAISLPTGLPVIPEIVSDFGNGIGVAAPSANQFAPDQKNAVADASVTASPTTFLTSATPEFKTYGRTVTEIETAWVTSFTTVDYPEPTEAVHKRHAHHAAHHHA